MKWFGDDAHADSGPPAATGRESLASRLEMWVALGLTAWVVALHFINYFHAGPLWRDEAATIEFASMPSWGMIWHNLQYDNFPPLFVAVARTWRITMLAGDQGYRLLGLLIGLGMVGVLWAGARRFGARTPLLALALFAATPNAVRVGDALRPHGLGIMLVLLTQMLIWRYIETPGRGAYLRALVVAVLSVQCLFQGAFFLLAFCLAGCLAAGCAKQWKKAGPILLIGAVAALSLSPILFNLSQGGNWREIAQDKSGMMEVLKSLAGSLNIYGGGMAGVILMLFVAAAVEGGYRGWKQGSAKMVYCGMGLVAGVALYLGFLMAAKLRIQAWYFLILLAPAALAMDAIWGAMIGVNLRLARPALALILALTCGTGAISSVKLRQSNVDLMAAKLRETARAGDLVLVSPWYVGVSFQRYYGPNGWATLPPMEELRIHRYDLVRRAMEADDPIQPVLVSIERALQTGHNVWLAGVFLYSNSGKPLPKLPRYQTGGALKDGEYAVNWMFQVTQFLEAHAQNAVPVPVPVPYHQPVNPSENLTLARAYGWRN